MYILTNSVCSYHSGIARMITCQSGVTCHLSSPRGPKHPWQQRHGMPRAPLPLNPWDREVLREPLEATVTKCQDTRPFPLAWTLGHTLLAVLSVLQRRMAPETASLFRQSCHIVSPYCVCAAVKRGWSIKPSHHGAMECCSPWFSFLPVFPQCSGMDRAPSNEYQGCTSKYIKLIWRHKKKRDSHVTATKRIVWLGSKFRTLPWASRKLWLLTVIRFW